MEKNTIKDRAVGAIMGAIVGDGLGLGCHWYYDLDQLRRDFGPWISGYTNSKPDRSDSFGRIARLRYDAGRGQAMSLRRDKSQSSCSNRWHRKTPTMKGISPGDWMVFWIPLTGAPFQAATRTGPCVMFGSRGNQGWSGERLKCCRHSGGGDEIDRFGSAPL